MPRDCHVIVTRASYAGDRTGSTSDSIKNPQTSTKYGESLDLAYNMKQESYTLWFAVTTVCVGATFSVGCNFANYDFEQIDK